MASRKFTRTEKDREGNSQKLGTTHEWLRFVAEEKLSPEDVEKIIRLLDSKPLKTYENNGPDEKIQGKPK